MKNGYNSTRSKDINVTASQGILQGLAPDGGLFVPNFIHNIQLDKKNLIGKSYGEMAQVIFAAFLDDFSEKQIADSIQGAYYSGKFEDEEPVALKKIKDRYFLELFHGPTCAFKDMALTILPYFMVEAMKNVNSSNKILILTATSGDTGKAALEGFANVPNISIIVFYPKDGVSTIQEKQMLTQLGDNTCVVGVDGNFDDTQNGVKKILNDSQLAKKLEKANVLFSSANSINIGRLLPQVVYYFYSYYELLKRGEITAGEKINFVVPTGNFGNILAGYYASLLGLPVNKLICASNANKVLTDFFKTGTYDRNREFYKTSSPSMDILISSNLERLLYDVSGSDPEKVSELMEELKSQGSYQASKALMEKADLFYAGTADEAQTAQSIKSIFDDTHYLMDPHTAVANKVYEDYLRETGDPTKTVIVSTASPYKFGRSVYESIFGASELDDYALLDLLAQQTDTAIPQPLKDLDQKENQHHAQCKKSEMSRAIISFLNERVENHD
ncbi:threonine synthase [Acetobacterium paludosum]|uniref:Threonine synthase n=1 Tax=Acetobacterium paludosum TaxID=52693 RepID=A0A923KXG3_9FIRM|nr:threonine synthase [Acetobacterium paludosum]MBC3889308.1 threonine synthase [Acetobacterium paludosum]